MPDALSVLIADDHDLFRRGMSRLLEEAGIVVVGEAVDGESAVRLTREKDPDVVVMDIHMPGMSGIEATREIVDGGLRSQVLVLTVSSEEAKVVDALVAGACGYLLKDSDGDAILAAIEAAAEGESVLSPRVAAKLVQRMRRDPGLRETDSGGDELTARERTVLGLIVGGLANLEIAKELYISENTVKNHVSSIFTKLSVDNRVQASVRAIREGLVEPVRPAPQG